MRYFYISRVYAYNPSDMYSCYPHCFCQRAACEQHGICDLREIQLES